MQHQHTIDTFSPKMDSIFYNSETKECRVSDFKREDIEEIAKLLQAGANPNHILGKDYRYDSGKSILSMAVSAVQLDLVDLLISYKATVNKKILTKAIDNYYSTYYFYKQNPERSLSSLKLLDEQYCLSQGKKLSPLLFKSTYLKLSRIMQEGIIQAEKQKKICVLIFGEYHTSVRSLFLEMLGILIAKELNIKHVLCEHNRLDLKNTLNNEHYSRQNLWEVGDTLIPYVKNNGFSLCPVDLGKNGAKKIGKKPDEYEEKDSLTSNVDNSSDMMMDYRDKIMHQVITDNVKEHSVFPVGASHLEGLNKKSFKNHRIVLISVAGQDPIIDSSMSSQAIKRHAFYNSMHVHQFTDKNLNDIDEETWYSEKTVKFAETIHKTYKTELRPFKIKLFDLKSAEIEDKKIEAEKEPHSFCHIL